MLLQIKHVNTGGRLDGLRPNQFSGFRILHRLLVKSGCMVLRPAGGKSAGNDGSTIAYDTRLQIFTLSTGLLPATCVASGTGGHTSCDRAGRRPTLYDPPGSINHRRDATGAARAFVRPRRTERHPTTGIRRLEVRKSPATVVVVSAPCRAVCATVVYVVGLVQRRDADAIPFNFAALVVMDGRRYFILSSNVYRRPDDSALFNSHLFIKRSDVCRLTNSRGVHV